MNRKHQNLEVVVAAWLVALPRQDLDALTELLAPDVVWHGVRPDLVCRDRDEVVENIRAQPGLPNIERLELLAVGDERAVLGLHSPDLADVAGEPLHQQVWEVFTIADGAITAIDEFTTRDEAVRAAEDRTTLPPGG